MGGRDEGPAADEALDMEEGAVIEADDQGISG